MRKLLLISILSSFLISCEDVIEVETPTDRPRLNIDALIKVQDNSENTTINITAKLTSSFFESSSIPEIDSMTLTNSDIATSEDRTISLIEQPAGSGRYTSTVTNSFLTSGVLILDIDYDNQQYTAETRFVPSVPISKLAQGTDTVFSDDEKEVIIAFNDIPDQENFYILDLDFNEYLATEDEFYPGQKFEFSYFYDDNVSLGREITVNLLGADKNFYDYMTQVIVQAGGDQGPFQTPAGTVKGNIIVKNSTEDTTDFVLGYFAIVQQYTRTIILE